MTNNEQVDPQDVKIARRRKLMAIWVCVGGCLTVWALIPHAREEARDSQCLANLKQIGLALLNYHDIYGSYPPAYVAGDDGQPVHSWRVLILPFIDNQALYDRYDFSVPWEDQRNRPVTTSSPYSLYACPSGESESSLTTNYLAVIGSNTAWPGGRSLTEDRITDNPSTTILVIETTDTSDSWAKPEDVSFESLLENGLSGNHYGHVNVLFADGRIDQIRTDLTPKTLKALLTVSGGESIAAEDWDARKQH